MIRGRHKGAPLPPSSLPLSLADADTFMTGECAREHSPRARPIVIARAVCARYRYPQTPYAARRFLCALVIDTITGEEYTIQTGQPTIWFASSSIPTFDIRVLRFRRRYQRTVSNTPESQRNARALTDTHTHTCRSRLCVVTLRQLGTRPLFLLLNFQMSIKPFALQSFIIYDASVCNFNSRPGSRGDAEVENHRGNDGAATIR